VCPLSAMLCYPAEVLWSVIRDQRIPNVPEEIQGDLNMTGTDLCVNKQQSVPVIFEPPCIYPFNHYGH
jgi:hypothetical protein